MDFKRIFIQLRNFGLKNGLNDIPGAGPAYRIVNKLILQSGSEYRTYPKTHEPPVVMAFSDLCAKGNTVIEIGGFHGSHSVNLSHAVGPSGEVIVFEPHPKHANLIRNRVRDNSISNVIIEEKAASYTDGEVQLWMDKDDSSTSSTAVSHEHGERYNVESVAIGGYIEQVHSKNVDLCKIDIEGGEYDLIMNSTLLSHTDKLICELHPMFIGRKKVEEILSRLHSTGIVSDLYGNEMTVDELSEGETTHVIWKHS